MVCHHLGIFGGHGHSGSEDIMFLVCDLARPREERVM